MYAKNKTIERYAEGGEELLKSIPLKSIRIVDKFTYTGKRSDLAVLKNKRVAILHNGLRQIILPVDALIEVSEEIAELAKTLGA